MYTPGFIAPVMGDTYLKQHDAPEDIKYYLCGPPMMSKTVLDLLHTLGVEDDMIMFDDLWQCHKLNRLQLLGFKSNAIGLLDNAVMIMVSRTHMRVLFYMVICASVFAENWGRNSL